MRSVWCGKMPLAGTLVILNLHDGTVGVDLAVNIVWSRFRTTKVSGLSARGGPSYFSYA